MAIYDENSNQHSDGSDSIAEYTPKTKKTKTIMKAINTDNTKGEWYLSKRASGSILIRNESNTMQPNKTICVIDDNDEEAEANAQRIVTAVNNHDVLIDALRECYNEFPCYDMQKETVLLVDKIKALLKIAE